MQRVARSTTITINGNTNIAQSREEDAELNLIRNLNGVNNRNYPVNDVYSWNNDDVVVIADGNIYIYYHTYLWEG